jgi:hypothetical protein
MVRGNAGVDGVPMRNDGSTRHEICSGPCDVADMGSTICSESTARTAEEPLAGSGSDLRFLEWRGKSMKAQLSTYEPHGGRDWAHGTVVP